MMLRILIILCSITFCQSKVGTSAAQFLGIGVGSKGMGMAGAYTSLGIEDPSIIYWNASAISRLSNHQFFVSNSKWIVDTNWNVGVGIYKLDVNHALGFYWTILDYGSEEVYTLDEQDGTGDYWSASDASLGVSYAKNLTDRISIGSTLKYIRQKIYHEKASSGAIDIGILYINDNDIRLGMSISNIGFDMIMRGKDLTKSIDIDPHNSGNNETIVANLKTDYWSLPIFFRVGVSKMFNVNEVLNLTTSIDGVIPSDDVEYINVGTEIKILNRFFVQAGLRQLGKADSEESFTIGVGIKSNIKNNTIHLNYVYQDFGILGYIPHLSMSINL